MIGNLPPFLVDRGELDHRDARSIAVVGARQASEDGLRRAARMARELIEHDVVIASGLAKDVDAAVHQATLTAGGRTFAVMGTGIAAPIYPAENRPLAKAILAAGSALLSQFWPTQPPPGTPSRAATSSRLARWAASSSKPPAHRARKCRPAWPPRTANTSSSSAPSPTHSPGPRRCWRKTGRPGHRLQRHHRPPRPGRGHPARRRAAPATRPHRPVTASLPEPAGFPNCPVCATSSAAPPVCAPTGPEAPSAPGRSPLPRLLPGCRPRQTVWQPTMHAAGVAAGFSRVDALAMYSRAPPRQDPQAEVRRRPCRWRTGCCWSRPTGAPI